MVKEEKVKAVENLAGGMKKHKIIGVIYLYKLPTRQMQEIKKKLGERVAIKVFKRSVLLRALDTRQDLKELEKNLPLQPAMVFTDEEPFKLYATISKLKSDVYAKTGDVADDEIMVYAGPTSLLPGPVISEFAKVKIPAGVEEGKIAVKKDTVAAKKGDVISQELASILRKLNIKPMKVGLNMVCIFDGANLYMKDVLDLVGDSYLNKVREAYMHALNLSVAVGYPTADNIGLLLAKAHSQAKYLEEKLIGGANQNAGSI